MAKSADGFELKLTDRGSWMVRRITRGREVDMVAVAWARDVWIDADSRRKFQKVNY